MPPAPRAGRRSRPRIAAGAVAAGLVLISGTGAAVAWEIEYRAPARGLTHIFPDGYRVVAAMTKDRKTVWCVYAKSGTLKRRTLTLDHFFIVRKVIVEREGKEGSVPIDMKAHFPDGSIWPLKPGKSIRYVLVANAAGRSVRYDGRLSVQRRTRIAVGRERHQAIIVQKYMGRSVDGVVAEAWSYRYAYLPEIGTVVVLSFYSHKKRRLFRAPTTVLQHPSTNARGKGRFPVDCDPHLS